jgi:polysaccharide biosynthesis/export protein
MRFKIFLIAIVAMAVTACVPRSKLVYLQTGSWDNPTDSAIATFSKQYKQYNLRAGDIVNISLGSVTPVEFDFVAQYVVQMGEILYLSPRTGKNGAQVFSSGNQQLQQHSAIQMAYQDKQALGFYIDSNGMLTLPKIGEIKAEGISIYELEKIVEEKLSGFFDSPQVRVQLLNFQFTVLGEVAREGRYTSFKDRTSLIEALTMAGNCTEFADRRQIKIIRTVANETSVIYINLLDAGFIQSQYFYLYPEDIIVIAPLKAKFWRQYVLPDTMQLMGLVSGILSIVALIYAINK